MRLVVLVLFSLVTLAPCVVHAETVAVLPTIGGSGPIPEAVRAEVREAIVAALRAEEWTVLEAADTRRRLGSQAACRPGDPCAVAARDALAVDLALGVLVHGTAAHPEAPERVVVQLTGIDGITYEGTATVLDSATRAAREALREALSRRALGTGPFLTVRGTSGAICEVDDEEVGTLPTTVRVTVGPHRVRVRLEGHEAQEHTVEIPPDALRTTSLDVTLVVESSSVDDPEVPVAPATRRVPDVLANVLIGGAFAAAGVALMVSPIHTIARLDECADEMPTPGGCDSLVVFDAQSGVLMGLGAAALAVGVIFLAGQPLTMEVQVTPDRAMLRLGAAF